MDLFLIKHFYYFKRYYSGHLFEISAPFLLSSVYHVYQPAHLRNLSKENKMSLQARIEYAPLCLDGVHSLINKNGASFKIGVHFHNI